MNALKREEKKKKREKKKRSLGLAWRP